MIAVVLAWVLSAADPDTKIWQDVARYETAAECEIGRVQWEMQHVTMTACEYDGRAR